MVPEAQIEKTHIVLIPSYNPGPIVYETVASARRCWPHVWVVVDGSTDGTGEGLAERARTDAGLKVIQLSANVGKGAAILCGLEAAATVGVTHVLTMDADGQHPADLIATFMDASAANPGHMILGKPRFDSSAPLLRVRGRRISNALADLETLWIGIGDSLFGFRVYPVAPLLAIMRQQRWMRGFDFDPEAVVRLAWRGVRPLNITAPVRYLSAEQGGTSHFNYWRDNLVLSWMHARLLIGCLLRLPWLIRRRLS